MGEDQEHNFGNKWDPSLQGLVKGKEQQQQLG